MTVILDALMTEAPALTQEQNEQLFQHVLEDYEDIPLKADRMKKVREDEYYNALQVKFGYAITCHKAQGDTSRISDCSRKYNSITGITNFSTRPKQNKRNAIQRYNQLIKR